MRKFKLVKCYPGSPELGTIHSDEIIKWMGYNVSMGMGHRFYEEHHEFWEEITNIYYLVFTKEETSFNAWEPIKVDVIKLDTDTKKYFSSKEGARDFIIQYKPCLSYNEVRGLVGHGFFGSTSHQKLFELVKSRI